MPRTRRINLDRSAALVTARGNDGRQIYVEADDCRYFLNTLVALKEEAAFRLHAFCLMPDHFHLLIETISSPISAIMQRLLTRYAKYFNRKHAKSGHLFGGRFAEVLYRKDAYLKELVRYVHLNPLRSKVVKDVLEWPWTSHRFYSHPQANRLVDAEEALSLFHENPRLRSSRYLRFLREGAAMGYRRDLHPPRSSPFLGEEAFVERCRKQVRKSAQKSLPRPRISLERLEESIKKTTGPGMLRSLSQNRALTAARTKFVLEALKAGHRPSAVAAFLGKSPSAVSKMVGRAMPHQKAG